MSNPNAIPEKRRSPYAYVTLLYGNLSYMIPTVVFGYSLRCTHTPYDIILLVTPDIGESERKILRSIYSDVIEVDHIEVNETLTNDAKSERFKQTYTKFRALNLTQYEKVLLCDNDMIIMKNIDHLFEINTPAGLIRSWTGVTGKKVPQDVANKKHYMVNAGVLLLEPSSKEFNNIILDLKKEHHETKFIYPEQQYLTNRYRYNWHHIGIEYNAIDDYLNGDLLKKNKIYVLHYASWRKPWILLSPRDKRIKEIEEFIEKSPFVKAKYAIWGGVFNIINEKLKKKGINILVYNREDDLMKI